MSNAAAEEALAHCHISSLLSRYYQAIDVANFTALDDEVLADDAVWEVVQHSPTGGTIEDTVSGRADIVAWFEQIMGGEVSMSEGTVRHFINTHVITVDGDLAHSTSHLQAVGTDTMAILSVGFAEADHVRTERGWRIRRYRLDEHITDADMAAFKAAFDTADNQ
jgi:hypothetical protein